MDDVRRDNRLTTSACVVRNCFLGCHYLVVISHADVVEVIRRPTIVKITYKHNKEICHFNIVFGDVEHICYVHDINCVLNEYSSVYLSVCGV